MSFNYLGQATRPIDAIMPAGPQQFSEIVVGIMVAVSLLCGLRNFIKNGDARLLICMVTGFLCVANESHAMYMMKFIYPPVGQNILYTGFGNPVPVFMGLMYCVFFGGANYAYLGNIKGQISIKVFCVGIVTLVISEALLEIVCIHFGLWAYYGNQAFVIFNFPIEVAVAVACLSMVYAAVTQIWFERVQGVHRFWLLIVGPIIFIGIFHIFSYPIGLALNSDGGLNASRFGAATNMAMDLMLAYAAVRFLSGISSGLLKNSTARVAIGRQEMV